MLILLTRNLILAASKEPPYLFIALIIGIVILLIVFLILRNVNKKIGLKKKYVNKVTPPITSIIGESEERIAELNSEIEHLGFAYDQYQDIFYSIKNPWQRSMGYCRIYDEATAPMSTIIDCEPIYFNYDGKKWLIELWKGQYGMTTGAEIGIYYTDGPDLNIPGYFNGPFYPSVSDEDRINMSFILRKNGNILFTRTGYHWWLTGFKLGAFSKPSELTMDLVLELHSKQMALAFVEALIKVGYSQDKYYVQGNKVYILYDTPYSPQPITRTEFTEYLVDRNVLSLINAYHYLTSEYTDTVDKLEIVRNESPNLYSHILNMGKTRGIFTAFHNIKEHLDH